MPGRDESRRAGDGGGDAAGLFNRVLKRAHLAVRELHLPVDWAEDLAQETMTTLFKDGAGIVSDEALRVQWEGWPVASAARASST